MADPTKPISLTRVRPVGTFLLGIAFLMRLWIAGGAAGAGTNTFIHTLFLAGAFLVLLSTLQTPIRNVYFSGVEIPLTLFLLLGTFSITWASYTLPAMQTVLAYLSFAIFGFTLYTLFQNRPHTLFTFLFGFLFVLSIYCLLQKYILLPEARSIGELDTRFQGSEMAARLSSVEMFGTFLYPNSLAGFLVFTLPIVGGMLFDLKKHRIPGILLFLLGGFILFHTGSLGGWVAFTLATGLLIALLLTRTRKRIRNGIWILAGAGLILITGLVATGPLSPDRLNNESMRIRDVYWTAALRISEDHLWTGVGLDNFQEYYPAYKGETQQETRKVHNDFLQILVELGILGLLLLFIMIGWTFRHALPPPKESIPIDVQEKERHGIILVGICSLFLAWLIEGAFGPLWVTLLAASWGAFVWFWHPLQIQISRKGMEGTRLGSIAGFCGLLIHMCVDFDFYEFGLSEIFLASLFLFPLFSRKRWVLPLNRAVSFVFLSLLGLILVPLLLILPRLLEADRMARTASVAKEKAVLLAQEAEETRSPLRREEARLESDAHYTQALNLYQAALEENPLEASFHIEYGILSLQLWKRIKNSPRNNKMRTTRMALEESRTITAFENTLRLRPRSIPAESLLTQAHILFANHYENESGQLQKQMKQVHLEKALSHAIKTLHLYPTRSHAHYEIGRILQKSDQGDQAKIHFEKALHLSENAQKEGLDRLQLDLFQKARTLYRLDRESEAHHLLKEWFESELETSQKGSLPAKLVAIETFIGRDEKGAKLRTAIGAEFDSFLAPRIIAVLKEILEALSNP
jgi:O-antigen ligase/tetratricopeptide (TPR) repeat protein